MRDADCVVFLQWALPQLGLSWPGFRKVRRQVCKRIAARIRALGLADAAAYRSRLEVYLAEWRAIFRLCTRRRSTPARHATALPSASTK